MRQVSSTLSSRAKYWWSPTIAACSSTPLWLRRLAELAGELISHLDRFTTELEAGKPDSRPRRRRNRAWRLPHARLQRLPPAWRRLIK
jgi:hypothetical protein